jgi:hypothetical protein
MSQGTLSLWKTRRENTSDDGGVQTGKINIPLLDAIQQVPAYAKFLKDLCT